MARSLATRAGLLTGVIAAVAVLIAGLVALPLVRGAAEAQAQVALASQADLVRDVATNPHDFDGDGDRGPSADGRALRGLVAYLRAQGVAVTAIVPGSSVPVAMTTAQVRQVAAGKPVSSRACMASQCVFVEARPVGSGTGIALIQPVSVVSAVTSTAVSRIALALVVGFAAAVAIGQLASRQLTKPLKTAARAAHRLAQGERDVRLTPEGPLEVAEIAEALNTLSEELDHSEGRQREFFLSISHELRTPLTAIRGYAEAMADGMVEAHETPNVGAVVTAEALRLDRLVSDLLDLARFGAVDFPLHIEDVNLRALLADAAQVWQSRADREGVDFFVDLPSSPVIVSTDPMRARQLIDNLAENALRVTPAGSPMVFALSADAVIEVRDGGPGLQSEDIAVAFEPGELYERYKGVRRVGTGFGLALVGRLATRLGVSAQAGAAAEGGAAFRLDFSSLQRRVD